jgi:hypothetical protein
LRHFEEENVGKGEIVADVCTRARRGLLCKNMSLEKNCLINMKFFVVSILKVVDLIAAKSALLTLNTIEMCGIQLNSQFDTIYII